MKEPHIEGEASHDDPRADVRKGGRGALTGARVGWVLGRRIGHFGVPRDGRWRGVEGVEWATLVWVEWFEVDPTLRTNFSLS